MKPSLSNNQQNAKKKKAAVINKMTKFVQSYSV